MSSRSFRIATPWIVAALCVVPIARGQEPPPRDQPWQPISWPNPTISLMDAVRTAIEHDPNLELEAQGVRLQEGVLQEASGRFDGALISDLSFEYTREALTASQRSEEEKNRQDLRDDIATTEQQLAINELVLDQLQELQADPTGARVSDPDIQAAIDLLNFQIQISSGSTRQSLIELRDQTIARAVDQAQEDRGDLLLDLQSENETLQKLGPTPEEQESYFGRYSLEYSKPFRTGIVAGPFFEYTLSGNRFVDKPVDLFRGGKGIEDVYRGELGLNFRVPLGRGFGRVATAADERAARFNLEAGVTGLSHAGATTVLSTALAYWDLVAAQERIAVLEELADIQGRLVELTDVLIRADEIPRSETARVGARQAEIQSQLESARRSEQTARIALADSLGLRVESLDAAPRASDPFPSMPASETAAAMDLAALVTGALAQRDDYHAARLLLESTETLLRAARANLKPIVDLDTRVWYTAVGEDDAQGAVTNRWVGPSYNLSLFVEWPFANNTQQGLLLQARARDDQQRIATEDLARRIRSSVVELVTTLQQTITQARFAERAAGMYHESLEAEIELYRAGASTLINTLLTEQRLTEARLSRVSVQQIYAQLLAQLRFVTGSLVSEAEDGRRVEESNLLDLPGAARVQG